MKPPPKGTVHRPALEELERRLLLSADAPSLLFDPNFADPGLAESTPAHYQDTQREDGLVSLADRRGAAGN